MTWTRDARPGARPLGTGCTCPDNPRGLSWDEAARDPDRVYVEYAGRLCVGFQERVHFYCPEHGKEVTR